MTDTGHSQSFDQLLNQMHERDAEFLETRSLPVDRLELTEDALIFDKSSIPLDCDGRKRLLAKAGAPAAYLGERSIDLQILALQEHFQQGDFGIAPRLVLRNGQLFSIRCDDLVELTFSEVMSMVAESLGDGASSLTPSKIAYADGQLELDLVSSMKSLEVRRGDVVTAGLHIEHTRFGDQATQIHAFVYRLVCENGMTRRECVSSEGIVRIRRLSARRPRGKELLLDQVRRLTARTWGKLEAQLQELRAASERRADVPQLLRQWVQRARFSARTAATGHADSRRTVMDRLLAAWREWGADDTYYAAVNALTWVASHDEELTPRQRRTLSLLGGLLAFSGVHLCPRCFSVISESVHPAHGHAAPIAPDAAGNE